MSTQSPRRPARPAASKRARKSALLSSRLAKRLRELARDIPYAAQLAEKLRQGCDDTTLGDILVDVACMQALKGNPTVIRMLWERCDGRLPKPPDAREKEPRGVLTPLKGPPVKKAQTAPAAGKAKSPARGSE
jgi:hypothetical protein